jgi:hypothetical protein
VRIVAFALVAVAVGGGCGGADGLTRESFAIEANAICTAANVQASALGRRPPLLSAEAATWMDEVVRIARQAVASLRTLEAPEDDRRLVEAMLSAFERGLARGEEISQASRSRDAADYADVVSEATGQLRGARLAAAGYGLDECARLARGLR